MESNAQIQAIFIALTAGLPMQSMGKVKVKIDSGIEDDRYALGTGAYSALKPTKVRHISLISLSGIEVANEWLQAGEEPAFDASETRRNIVLKEITASELNNLVGQLFWLGNIKLLGTELCTPCERPAQLVNKPRFMDAFEERGGIRAKVLNSGELSVGDKLILENKK